MTAVRKSMYFSHSAIMWQQFPQLVPGVLVIKEVHPHVEGADQLQPWFQRAHERLGQGLESDLPEISAWRRAYAQMGLKPTQYRSAAEALLRRFRKEGDLPRLHPLVDLCNALSLAFALPVAVFDLAKVADYLEVRHARGDEQYLAFNGEIERPEPGEVIFADTANQVHARRWTFRQSRHSTVEPETRQALIVSEGLHATAAEDVPALIDALAQALTTLGTAPQERAILTSSQPRLEFSL
jgi:DNA/RNA-binding domain of Phe-tRNA-synthetase-like protein